MSKMSHDDFLVLATARADARIKKDFNRADLLRREIEEGGYWIEDGPDGSYSFGEILDSVTAQVVVETVQPKKSAPKKRKSE